MIESNREAVTLLEKTKGMGREAPCTVTDVSLSLPEIRIAEFVRCEVLQAPHDLPDGEYFVSLGSRNMLEQKENSVWLQGGSKFPASSRSAMKKHCEEGKILCEQFADKLKDWGFAEVNREAADRIVGGCANPNLKELFRHAVEAERGFLDAKRVYVVHVASCLLCSRKLLAPSDSLM